MAFDCNKCDRRFISEESLKQHEFSKHQKTEKEFGLRNYVVFALISLIVILSLITVYSYSSGPGEFDDFAKCLTEKGAVVYGNDFCTYTGKQLNFFGSSEKYINYIKCSDDQGLCDSKGVTTTPTWEINGKIYPQVQTFERLSDITGCEV